MDYEKEIEKLKGRVLDLEEQIFTKLRCLECSWVGFKLIGTNLSPTVHYQCPNCGSNKIDYA